jgi:hypothetical protein
MPQRRDTLTMTRGTHLSHHLIQFAGTRLMLLVDALRYFGLCRRSPAALAAENLFLRSQLALYRERDVRPRHATHAARLALIWLGRCFDWRNAIAACFGPEAIHYSPAGPKWAGAAIIGHHFATRVREQGQGWTVDHLVTDADRCTATLAWTRFDRHHARILRGVDGVVFEPQTFHMQEVRPYTSAPSIPTWRAKQDARVMMPGAGSRRGALQTRRAEVLTRHAPASGGRSCVGVTRFGRARPS